MIARVTLAEIDAVRTPIEEAVRRFEESVVPALREQPGYEGTYVLTTPEGKALVLTFWENQEALDAGVASGFYAEQLEKFVTFYKSPPGRETYDVAVADEPAASYG